MTRRIGLEYSDWGEVLTDVRKLSDSYTQNGARDLAQAANHLNG